MSSSSYRYAGIGFNDETQQADIAMLTDGQIATGDAIGVLVRQINSMRIQLFEVSLLASVLANAAVEAGLDPAVLRARVDAERAARKADDPRSGLVECAKCHRKVPSTQTNITEGGVLCDACV
ncbi:MAG TPA: hypothetical protein VGM90_08215 [Kofleriaceae bacterium]|jgi:cytochrome c553